MEYDQKNFGRVEFKQLADEMKEYSQGKGTEEEVRREVNKAMQELVHLDVQQRLSLERKYAFPNRKIPSTMLSEVGPRVLEVVHGSFGEGFNIRKIAGDISETIENVLRTFPQE